MLFAMAGSGAARAEQTAFDLAPGTRVLAPIVYKQLALMPIVRASAAAGEKADYMTLAEGLKSKQVEVGEKSGGAEVNRVTVKNRSKRALLLLGGQVILGGQQDRIIGKDTVLAPGESANLEVFCVEHGRWSGHTRFGAEGGMAEAKTRVRAKFRSDQSSVWSQVAVKESALHATNATGTYRNLAVGEEGKRATKPYRDAVAGALDKLPEAKQQVGYVAAVNGRVTNVEKFATPELFAKYRDQLLDSLFIAVADVPVTVSPAAAAPKPEAVRAFMKSADEQLVPDVRLDRAAAATIHKKGKGVVSSKLAPKASPTAKPAEDKPVYESYQADE
jgi:hypothetical protein